MSETAILSLNGVEVFAFLVSQSERFRIRVWSAEWQNLDFAEGQILSVHRQGRDEQLLMVSAVVAMPDTGLTWVEFLSPVGNGRQARPIRVRLASR